MNDQKEFKLTDAMDGFEEPCIDYSLYEISFRRWLIMELDTGRITDSQAKERFGFPSYTYGSIIKRWRYRYSEELQLSLSTMSSKDLSNHKALEARIKKLESELSFAQKRNVALQTLIDLAEKDLKIQIRKKSGPKQ
ncbi:MAG: hypothetical protein AAGC43_17145 [Bacteroidota bacterium]